MMPNQMGNNEVNPDEMRKKIIEAARQIKEFADQYGVDISDIFTRPARQTPPPPMPGQNVPPELM